MKKILIIFSLVLLTNLNSSAQNDIEKIRSTLNQYIKGLKEGDKSLLNQVFDNTAILKSINLSNGTIQNFPVQNFISSTPNGGIDVEATINTISYAGYSGQAVVELSLPAFKYIDLISLLKINNEWKIVARIFSRAELDESVTTDQSASTTEAIKPSTKPAQAAKKPAPKPKAKVEDDGW